MSNFNEISKYDLMAEILFIKKEIDKNKEIARLAPETDYQKGYLKAITNVTAIIDEYIMRISC